MAELRSRKSQPVPSAGRHEEEDVSKSRSTKRNTEPLAEASNLTLGVMFVLFTAVMGSFLWYQKDSREGGPFSTWVDKKYAVVSDMLNRPSTPMFGAAAAETTADVQLTEEQLKAYDGTDGKPIYLAIEGVIYDVSASPAFYGPGGHYHHFTGKDATRAWVTECWDEPEQFTWRMDDVDVMFMPRYLDESLEEAGEGQFNEGFGDLGTLPKEMMQKMAKEAMEKLGPVSDKEKKKRRKSDVKEASKKVREVLDNWVNFFKDNAKYHVVGTVVRDESRPAPPKPCKKAMEKRPLNGGKLEALMGNNIGKQPAGGKPPGKPKKPKKKSAEEKKKKKTAAGSDEDVFHEEL